MTASAFALALHGRASSQTVLRLASDQPKVQEIIAEPASHDDPGNRFFGKGAPFEIHDLPEGELKTNLLATACAATVALCRRRLSGDMRSDRVDAAVSA